MTTFQCEVIGVALLFVATQPKMVPAHSFVLGYAGYLFMLAGLWLLVRP